ncbi:MAG: alpha-L-rhamnosidase [Bacteroidales bacterium]|nr:alpha-L-rhamnosidase [Bacteroidales bacterium]
MKVLLLAAALSLPLPGAAVPPPELVREAQKPERISRFEDGAVLADFGRDAFAQMSLRLRSDKDGDTVLVHLGERLSDGRVARNPGGSVRYRLDTLVLRRGTHDYSVRIRPDKRNTGPDAIKMPSEIGEVLPFRYCELEGYSGPTPRRAFTRWNVHHRFDDGAARFRCDNDTLNRIWELCRYSVKATSFTGYYVDGDRERIPYEADALIGQLCHYAADCEFTMARRTLAHLLEHPTWPTEWILQCIPVAWNDYLFSGDDAFLRAHYPQLKAHCLLDLREPCGLISTTTGRQSPELLASIARSAPLRDIVDWPHSGSLGLKPGEGGEDDGFVYTACNTVVNAWYYHALTLMEQIAAHLGEEEDRALFAAAAAAARDAFDQLLYDAENERYKDGIETEHASLHGNMFALLFGLVPQERVPGVVRFIRSRGMACSVYGAQFLLDALYEARESDYAFSLLTSGALRSWYNMIRVGSTISLEAWDDSFKPNQDWNHIWGAAPGNLIPFRLMGIRPLEPGFASVLIDPQPGPLKRAVMRIKTVKGPLTVRVRQSGGTMKVRIRAPRGVKVVRPTAEAV